MKLAVDAMGGDRAPQVIVEGALSAVQTWKDLEIVLVGDEQRIQPFLKAGHSRIHIRHTKEWITAEDEPVKSIRRKKEASMVLCGEMVKNGEAEALISAGNTGALMATALLIVGRMAGIERPALASILPTLAGKSVMLLDSGANMDASPQHLLDYAEMGYLYMNRVQHIDKPRIGLLNVGTEAAKGNQLTKQAYPLLEASDRIRFVGNIEARDLVSGEVDVVVCDGFIGNVVLKFYEGIGSGLLRELKSTFLANWRTKLGALLVKQEFKRMQKKFDYAEYGGAPMLGIEGICIKAHGSSNARAIHNAIGQAYECVKGNVVETIRELKHMGDDEPK
ncbi:phosphate acyltransferase PlsX [Fodinisporobacter ferrooxydans]|uniref:Phosphate acyltransferase n=1 Tax=Fodinisporobacter ferrooxydans TaxID=2901836 RepID=A0ABY4CFB7_9BACL|nr:phosphate acyltransferase PlsX [Alicyclobacillaceae bacterium MYW30-H2]